MKNKWILGVIVLVVILGGLFFMGYIEIPGVDSADTDVSFYNADGDEISLPLAIMAGGQEVETMKVKISWTIQGTNIQDGTFNVDVDIIVRLWDWDRAEYVQFVAHSFDSNQMISEGEHTWTLADILPMEDPYMTDGWKLKIYGTLRASAIDLSGNPIESDMATTDAVYAELTWLDTTATLSIVLYEVKRYIQLPP